MNAPFPPVIAQCDRGRFLAFLRQQGEKPEGTPTISTVIRKTTKRMIQNLPDQAPNEWIKGRDGKWRTTDLNND